MSAEIEAWSVLVVHEVADGGLKNGKRWHRWLLDLSMEFRVADLRKAVNMFDTY